MIRFAKTLWTTMKRPSVHFSLGFLTFGGFCMGIIFWGGFNTAVEYTNTEAARPKNLQSSVCSLLRMSGVD